MKVRLSLLNIIFSFYLPFILCAKQEETSIILNVINKTKKNIIILLEQALELKEGENYIFLKPEDSNLIITNKSLLKFFVTNELPETFFYAGYKRYDAELKIIKEELDDTIYWFIDFVNNQAKIIAKFQGKISKDNPYFMLELKGSDLNYSKLYSAEKIQAESEKTKKEFERVKKLFEEAAKHGIGIHRK
jgi:hypothetical protein